MVSPLHKKRAVKHVVEKGMCSLRRACRYLGLSRSQYYREPKAAQEGEESLLKRLIELSLLFPRYGYRPVTHLLQREGLVINHKKVQRIRRKEGLGVKPAKPKSKRRGKSTAAPASAGKVNAVWCWDFIFDTTEDGRRLKIFSLVDEYSRFCLRLRVGMSMTALDVVSMIQEAAEEYGMPEAIRSDNGPEFIAKEIQEWIEQSAIETMYIEPGCPWQNPWVESFHSRLRDECLDRELFFSVKEAQLVLEDHRELYNTYRVHSGIDYKSPIEIFNPQGSGSGRATPVLHRSLLLPIVPCLT